MGPMPRASFGWLVVTAALCAIALGSEYGGSFFRGGFSDRRPYCPVNGSNPAFWGPPPASQPQPSDPGEAEPAPAFEPRKLTRKEINRIRYLELRGIRLPHDPQPDRVTVKLSTDVVNEFLMEMEGHQDFQGESSRRDFRKLTPALKLHYIAAYKGAAFADKVEIESDPQVFLEFRRNVLPTVLRGCATTGCHAPTAGEPPRFYLFKDPKKSTGSIYANFVILNDLDVGGYKLLDRGHPENSLLITYMLPAEDVRVPLRHPGDPPIRPLFQSRNATGLRRIRQWIESLKHPAGDYGVHLVHGHGTTTSSPSDEPPPLP